VSPRRLTRECAALVEAGHQPIMDGVTPHSLRRTFASMLAKRGEDPPTMMQQLGHATAEFTFEVYAKAGDADRDAWERLWRGEFGQLADNQTDDVPAGAGQQEAVYDADFAPRLGLLAIAAP
jgi:Phage integrase family